MFLRKFVLFFVPKTRQYSSKVFKRMSWNHQLLTRNYAEAPLAPQTEPTCNSIREKVKDMVLSKEQLLRIQKQLIIDVEKGLGKSTHANSIVKCFVTYIQDLPTGKESGRFLALDLGGTNFRVLLVTLSENHSEMKSKIFAVPQHIMLGSGEQLFDHIADCMATFMKEENVLNENLPLGFTFSFPLTQKSLTSGLLERWTKGFNCSNVIGNDVVKMLKDAISRRGFSVDVKAIINDTTGTLLACAYACRDCRIGLIVGTGTNACYVEKQKNAELFDAPDEGSGNVLINTEWGAFGDDGSIDFVRTQYDREIDTNTINKGRQLFEKMISGMYMGEIARLVIQRFVKEKLLFQGVGSDQLFTRNKFYTKYVSEIESDPPGVYRNCKSIMHEIGIPDKDVRDEDLVNVRFLCEIVSRRSAHLVSATISALINRVGEKRVTVGIDGSVYRFHPHFHNLMMEKIGELVRPEIMYDLMLSEDGSGRGAALIAAVASKKR